MLSHPTSALVFTVGLAALMPVVGVYERRFLRSAPDTAAKVGYYRLLVAASWGAAAIAMWIAGGAIWASPDNRFDLWPPIPSVARLVLWVVVTAYLGLALLPLMRGLVSPRARKAYASAYSRDTREFPGFLPRASNPG